MITGISSSSARQDNNERRRGINHDLRLVSSALDLFPARRIRALRLLGLHSVCHGAAAVVGGRVAFGFGMRTF